MFAAKLTQKSVGNLNRRALAPILFGLALLSGNLFAQTLAPENIYQKLLPSVVTLRVENARGETFVGTAFLALDKNVAVTAWHVVSDAVRVTAKFSDERVVNVDCLIDKDELHDLALVRLDAAGHSPVSLCTTGAAIGSRAYVIGAPKGFEFSITDGLVSQVQKIRGADQYQVSCPISGGNSGGPVVNDRGEVLGVAAWTQKDAQNVSFAIPAGFLCRLDPKHSPTPWSESAKVSAAEIPHAQEQVKTSEPQRDVAALRNALANAAGKHVAITISSGGEEKKFDVVLPGDFVKP